jgi:hypothetical protein
MIRKSLLIVLLIFISDAFARVGNEPEGIALVKEIFQKLNGFTLPSGSRVYFFDYQVKTVLKNQSAGANSDTRVKYYMNQDYTQIVSDKMEVYKDPKNTFTIIPMRKAIYWADSPGGTSDTSIYKSNLGLVQNKIFETCKLKSSRDISSEEKYNKEITILTDQKMRESTGMDEITFLVNSRNKTAYKVIVKYTSSYKIQYVEFTYHHIDFDYSKVKINESSKLKIFKSEGVLLPKYTGYKVVDVRKNKS